MRHVISILKELGVDMTIRITTEEAINDLSTNAYDAVISDMQRGAVIDEGTRLLTLMRGMGLHPPVIFTVGRYQPELGTPPYSFGITNRVDDLLKLLFDALERSRG